MSAKQISDISVGFTDGKMNTYAKSEWMIDAESDISSIPQVAPGSIAYTPDLSYMAMYDGEEWHEIGGGA